MVSVAPAQATDEHSRQARRRGLDVGTSKLCVAEVIIAKLCLSEQEEEVRWRLFDSEAARASAEGRAADCARFRAEQARLCKPFPRMGLQDALILTQNLKSNLFEQALRDDLAEVYWSSTAAALHEFLRLAGNRLPEKSYTETREAFRTMATSVGLTKFCISVLCSAPESVLRQHLEDLRGSIQQQNDVLLSKLRTASRSMLEYGRKALIAILDDPNFLLWLKQGVSSDGGQRVGSSNPFSLQTSCLDAFHFEHFKNSTQNSKYCTSSTAAKIFQILSARIQSTLLRQEALPSFQYVLSISRTDNVNRKEEESKPLSNQSNKVVFLPSVLFICVGIAAIITSNLFVQSITSGVRYRDLIYSATNTVADLQVFAGDFATAMLDLMTCIDPELAQDLKKISPAQYATQLKSWPPLLNAISAITHDPSIVGATREVQDAVLSSVKAAIPNIMTGVVAVTVQTMTSSLSSGQSMSAATASATTAAQQVAVQAVNQLIANETQNPKVTGLISSFPGLIAPAVQQQLINLSRPEIIATLPLVGPTLACLSSTLSSGNVQTVVQLGKKYTNARKIPKVSFFQSVAADPCRENLEIDACSEQWKQVYPASAASRQQLYVISTQSSNSFPDFVFSMMNKSAKPYSVSKSCQYYESLGCSSVATLTVQARSVAGWGEFVNSTRDLIDSYLNPFNDTIDYASDFARRSVLPCFIFGHVVAFVSAMIMTLNVLYRFQQRLVEMRAGKQPYKYVFQKTSPTFFSSTSTPTLGGMVLATAYAQYYVRFLD